MADITITAANVVPGTGAVIENHTAGAAITAGQAVYYDTSTLTVKLADCDNASSTVRSVRGIALNSCASGQPVAVQVDGLITIGATIAAGVVYCLSDTAGGIRPVADQGSGDYTSVIGIGTTTAIMDIQIHNSGAAVA